MYGDIIKYWHDYQGKKCTQTAYRQRLDRGIPPEQAISWKSMRLKGKVGIDGRECNCCHEYKTWKCFAQEKNGWHGRTPDCLECRQKKKAQYRSDPSYRAKEQAYKVHRRKMNPDTHKADNIYYNDPQTKARRAIVGKQDRRSALESKIWYFLNKGYPLSEISKVYRIDTEMKRRILEGKYKTKGIGVID